MIKYFKNIYKLIAQILLPKAVPWRREKIIQEGESLLETSGLLALNSEEDRAQDYFQVS